MTWRICRDCDDERHVIRTYRGIRYYCCRRRGLVVLDVRADPRGPELTFKELAEALRLIEETESERSNGRA